VKIVLVGGARPNFMKLAPIASEFEKQKQEYILVHTGQHYDEAMSHIFFGQLGLREPDYNFGISPPTHASMTAQIMTFFERLCFDEKPDLVVVVGDVNSTLACALVSSKIEGIKLAHVEAGARSFDRSMPEEVNRIVTDVLSDYLFAISSEHTAHLLNEGIEKSRIHLVGDVMIDTLLEQSRDTLSSSEPFILVTLHRQSNVDDMKALKRILIALKLISQHNKVILPLHPRTKKMINSFGLNRYLRNIDVRPPLGYFEFINLMKGAKIILTDSGSIQVESTVLDIPCLTMRNNTERVFTLREGTNRLVGNDTDKIIEGFYDYVKTPPKSNLSDKHKKLFDGHTAERIVDILLR
jgi:UDP-N-acetylglucosamine 2-epimerase (non-hydrolysing)